MFEISEYTQQLVNWINHNPNAAGLLTFIISAMESIAVIGTIVPGTVTMTAVGGLIGLGIIPFGSTMLWAIAGAVAGDGFSFWLGVHFKDQVTSDPKLTADMYASLETMRGGDCRFIEALMIPEADKKVYVENVIGGQVPVTLHDQMIAQRYIQKIRCNYTPMLMQNSTN